jgi:UbiD family decarboxylase
MPRIKLTKSTIDTLPQASPRTIISILSPIRRVLSRKLEIAVAIGNHPAVLLGSQLYFGLGDDEYENIGGLLGEPPRLVRCRTVDLEVPAEAEIVLEGELDPDDLVPEGSYQIPMIRTRAPIGAVQWT